MSESAYFLVALQSGLVLGLVHGVNPCGHSWVVLTPFVMGNKSGWRVARLTASFILGTALGCLAIAATLGSISAGMPESVHFLVNVATAGIIVVLGILMIVRPHLLHHHDHDHDDHHHEHDHDPHHDHGPVCAVNPGLSARAKTAWGLAILGFVNMIVPCPTLAMMYSYAINAADVIRALAVFGAYALGTGVALAGVIFAIYKVSALMGRMQQPWIETAVMRLVGLMTIAFGIWALRADLA